MTCRDFSDFIIDYLSGELPQGHRAEFERHLDLCVNCQKYLTSYRESVSLGKRAFDDEQALVPDDVPGELVRAILAARAKPGH